MGRLVRSQVLSPAIAPILRFRIASLFAAQLFDFGTFRLMIERHGIAAEANPIVAQGFISFGLPIVVLAKVALVVLVGSILVLLGREATARPTSARLATIVVVAAVGAGLLGGISNARVG